MATAKKNVKKFNNVSVGYRWRIRKGDTVEVKIKDAFPHYPAMTGEHKVVEINKYGGVTIRINKVHTLIVNPREVVGHTPCAASVRVESLILLSKVYLKAEDLRNYFKHEAGCIDPDTSDLFESIDRLEKEIKAIR